MIQEVLERCGYRLDGDALFAGERFVRLVQPERLDDITNAATLLADIDRELGDGQHHMACQCGMPLLRVVTGTVTRYYLYRSVEAGPCSPALTNCERCGARLDIETVGEISLSEDLH